MLGQGGVFSFYMNRYFEVFFIFSCSLSSYKVHKLPLNEDQCGEATVVDVGFQPNNVHFIQKCPGLALVSTDSGIVLLRGTEVALMTSLGYVVTASAVSPDGSEAIVGSQDGKLHIYVIDNDMFKEEAVLEQHRGAITVIQYSPDASMFASADANREAVVWDRASREVENESDLSSLSFMHAMHL